MNSRKRISRQVMLFVAALLALHVALQLVAGFITDPSVMETLDRKLLAQADKIDVLITGDSHPLYGVDCGDWPGAFNMATPGENYTQTRYRLLRVLEDDRLAPEAILVQMDLHSFSSFKVDRFRPDYAWGQYVPFLSVGIRRGQPWRYFEMWLTSRFHYLGAGKRLLDSLPDPVDNYAAAVAEVQKWHKRVYAEQPLEERRSHARKMAVRHGRKQTMLDEAAVTEFHAILDVCRKKNIRVVLVKYPMTQGYIDAMAKFVQPDAFYAEILGGIGQDEKPLVLDYQSEWAHDLTLFVDCHHLNARGAALFTERVRADLQDAGIGP